MPLRFLCLEHGWLPLLVVVLVGLASACSGRGDAAPQTSQPAATQSSTNEPTAIQLPTTEGSPTQPAPTQPPVERVPSTIVLGGPLDQDRSEPHIRGRPRQLNRMYAVAQGALPIVSLDPRLFWRSDDAGRTESEPLVMGFIDNTQQGAAGDRVDATGADGLVLFGGLGVTPPPR